MIQEIGNHIREDAVKEEILDEARRLFQQYGLKKTTMDDIALASGKAKSTLYYYFKNKDEVIDSVINYEIVNLRQYVKKAVDKQENMHNKIKTYVLDFYSEVFKRENLYRIIKRDSTNKPGKIHFQKMVEFEQAYLTRILEDGYDAGEYKNVKKEEIPSVAQIIITTFYGAVLYMLEIDGALDCDKIEKAADFILQKLFN